MCWGPCHCSCQARYYFCPLCIRRSLLSITLTDHDCDLPVHRNDSDDSLSGDHEAAFQAARDRVQEWLHEVGALGLTILCDPFA